MIKMIKYYKKFLIVLFSMAPVLLMLSCSGFEQESISMSVNVDDMPTILVINAEIEEDSLVWVELGYAEDIDAIISVPRKYEDDATVSLSTGSGQAEKLSHLDKGRYEGSAITGKVGETYTLTISIGSQTYSGTSTMLESYGYDTAWVVTAEISGKTGSYFGYSDEWRINDPSATRDRYLFEWWTNGEHIILRDWAIDDNRVVNANESLRLFTVTMNPGPNERVRHRCARIEKLTYDYYNMYEKIVRKLIGVSSQTPYNPVSNFGEGTIGNFRAVSFHEYHVLTPPSPMAVGRNQKNILRWDPNYSFAFVTYHLFWDTKPGVTNKSNHITKKITDMLDTTYSHIDRTNDVTYYYKLAVEDRDGNISVLSPEVSTTPFNGLFEPDYVLTEVGDTQVTLTWELCPAAETYSLYWNTKPGVIDTSKIISDLTDTTYIHTALSGGTSYFYHIGAVDSVGTIKLSKEVRAVPNTVTATPDTGEIVISWGDVTGASAYYIAWDTVSVTPSKDMQTIDNVTSPYTHDNLEPGKKYYYRIVYAFIGGKDVEYYLSQEVSVIPNKR
jgi:hypothetical protein